MHHALCTLHHALYTLHFAPCALHLALCTCTMHIYHMPPCTFAPRTLHLDTAHGTHTQQFAHATRGGVVSYDTFPVKARFFCQFWWAVRVPNAVLQLLSRRLRNNMSQMAVVVIDLHIILPSTITYSNRQSTFKQSVNNLLSTIET